MQPLCVMHSAKTTTIVATTSFRVLARPPQDLGSAELDLCNLIRTTSTVDQIDETFGYPPGCSPAGRRIQKDRRPEHDRQPMPRSCGNRAGGYQPRSGGAAGTWRSGG